MDIAKKIKIPAWIMSDALLQLMGVINGVGEKPKSMIVGGAVRNAVMGFGETDIDIATQYTPQEIIEKCMTQSIKIIPTGIDHGTVTAVLGGKHFEITTLRNDIETDGRHAKVAYTNHWEEDARRRDFTMNAMLMDMAGNVYDPTGRGLADLMVRRVVFVGVPEKRIAEDYLRVLRFFRFQAQYGAGELDSAALKACADAADKITTLSKERVTQEFIKIMAVRDPTDILKVMQDHHILSDIFDKNYQADILHRFCYFQDEFQAQNMVSRLYVLAGMTPRLFDGVLLLTHIQKKFMIKLEMATRSDLYIDMKSLKKAIFYHGREVLMQGYLLICARNTQVPNEAMVDTLQNWEIPECPITGQSLLEAGYKTGPELGQELERLKEEWLERII